MLDRNKNHKSQTSVSNHGGEAQGHPSTIKRVAHLHSTLGVYGSERWTHTLLKNHGHEFVSTVITVGTREGSDSFYKFLQSENISSVHVPIDGKLNRSIIRAVRQLLIERKIDILHTHGFKADVLGYFAAKRTSVALVSTLHGWSQDEGLRIKLYEDIGRFFLKHYDHVYANSPALFDGLLEKGFKPGKIKLILNAVDLSGFNYKEHLRQEGEAFRFLFVGRLCRPKGVYELLEAFSTAGLADQAELMIVGDGPEMAGLVDMAHRLGVEKSIRFTGVVDNVSDYMDRAHALVLPSYSEGIPRVVMEAFAAGVPVIATDIAGVRQLVVDKINGYLIPVKDIQSLAAAMEYMKVNPEVALQYAKAARETVVEKFSGQRMANDYESEYRRLLALQAK